MNESDVIIIWKVMSWQCHLITTKNVEVKENMAVSTALETVSVPKLKVSSLYANI